MCSLLNVLRSPFCTLTFGQTGSMKIIDEDEVGLKEKTEHTRYIKEIEMDSTLVLSDSGGIRRLVVRKIHLKWKTIQNAYHLATNSSVR